MPSEKIHAPVPLRSNKLLHMKKQESLRRDSRLSSSFTNMASLRKELFPSGSSPRPRSVTPRLFNLMDSEDILKARLKHYNLDFVDDKDEHEKNIYDPNSKWYSREKIPKFAIEKHLPYATESHKDQAKYLCHILVNLYIAISSKDIEGLIAISSKDLAEFKTEIDNLALNTDLFRLSNNLNETDDGTLSDDLFNTENISDVNPYASGKIKATSATIINVNHWTNELRNCFNFEFPVVLRKLLAKTYYYLSLIKGQDIDRKAFVDIFEDLVDIEDEGTNFTTLLKDAGLVLDHNILIEFLRDFFPYPDSDYDRYDLSNKEDATLFRLILKLADSAKPFFDDTDENLMSDMMKNLLASVAPSTTNIVLPMITSAVPYHYNSKHKITDYFPFCFGFWSSVSANISIDTHMYDFMGAVAEETYWQVVTKSSSMKKEYMSFGQFGTFTNDQLTFMFNRLQGHLREDGQIHSYSRTVRPFIYSINGEHSDLFFEKLLGLTRSIETFTHPSNTGFWTKPIAKFVHSFIKVYHERVMKEIELSTGGNCNESFFLKGKDHAKIVDLFLSLIELGAQNKNSEVSTFFISSLSYLLHLEPENSAKIYEQVLFDVYEALLGEYVNSRHRIISSLKKYTRIVRFLTRNETYRLHITHILSLLVSKLDVNDVELTNHLINAVVTTVTFVPISNLVPKDKYLTFESNTLPFIQQHFYSFVPGGEQDEIMLDEESIPDMFIASTTIFEDILKAYIDKLYQFVDVGIEEGMVTKINQTTLIMLESMDDKMFTYFAKQFIKKIWDNDNLTSLEPNYELLSIPLGGLAKRDKTLCIQVSEQLAFHIREQIKRGAGQQRSSQDINQRDVKLVLYLSSMNEILRQSHEKILDIGDKINEFLIFLYESVTSPPVSIIVSILVHNVLSSLVTTEIKTARMFKENCEIPPINRWGGLQFNEERYNSEHLKFDWHVPENAEINFAVNLFNNISEFCETKLLGLLKVPKNDTTYWDEMQKYLLILTHLLSGASLLFDPDFNENKANMYQNISYKERLMLLKTLRQKECSNTEVDIDLELDSLTNGDEYIGTLSPKKDSDIIELNEPEEEDIIYDFRDETSQAPSGITTPVQHAEGENGTTALLSSGLVFRDLDMYTCNYFFGLTAEQKFLNPLYPKVHKIRATIGLIFHKVFKVLTKQEHKNIMVYQILLHGLKVWFTDVGQETLFSDDPSSFIDEEFLENIQAISDVEEPFTRTLFAVKTGAYHQTRTLLRSTNRRPSKLEIGLLKDVINLATSIYPDIHKPAQGTLIHSMKQLVGAYSTIIKVILDELEYDINKNDYMKLRVTLKVLMMKKLNRKLLSDYEHLERIVNLLIRCFDFEESEIISSAECILIDLVVNFKVPSSICIMDDKIFEKFAPPDDSINLQIDAVIKAKELKRKQYLSTLLTVQDHFIALGNKDTNNWQLRAILIHFLSRIQSHLEVPTNSRAAETIFKQAYTKHPEVVTLVIKGTLRLFTKFFALADYNYDLNAIKATNYDTQSVEKIDSSLPNFSGSFKDEMSNFDAPRYFIDNKCFVGWLCWGRNIKVVKPEPPVYTFKSNEIKAMTVFGELFTIDWLKEMVSDLIQDNETKHVFSSGHVSFFCVIIFLIRQRFTSLNLKDILALCEQTYDKYDKSSMILSVEICAALVCSSKYMDAEMIRERDIFLNDFLTSCLDKELNHDAFEIWATISWWIPTAVDIRRCPIFFKHFLQISRLFEKTSDAASKQASHILMLKNLLGSTEYRSPDLSILIPNLVFDHPYDQVREAVAKLFSTVIYDYSHFSKESADLLLLTENKKVNGLGIPIKAVPKELDVIIKQQFREITEELKRVIELKTQDILNSRFYYLTSTMYYWCKEMGKGPNRVLLVPYMVDYIAPFLMELVKHKDFCSLAGIDPVKAYVSLAYMPIGKNIIPKMINLFCNNKIMTTSNQIRIQLSFIQHFFSAQLLQLSEQEKSSLLNFVIKNLYNEEFMEVRVKASHILSDIVHNLGECKAVFDLIEQFSEKLVNVETKKRKKLSKSDIQIHGSVLGLGAIISAFPYIFPLSKWIPKELSVLSDWARTNGIAGTAAKDFISEFKKIRTDTWKFDQLVFSQDQLEDLEGVLWRSYYA